MLSLKDLVQYLRKWNNQRPTGAAVFHRQYFWPHSSSPNGALYLDSHGTEDVVWGADASQG